MTKKFKDPSLDKDFQWGDSVKVIELIAQFKKALIQERKWREDAEYERDKMERTLDDAQDWFGQKAWKEFTDLAKLERI